MQERVAGLGDAAGDRDLRIDLAGGSDQSRVRVLGKRCGSSRVRVYGKRAHAADIAEQFRFRLLIFAKAFDLSVIGVDLLGERSDGLENGSQSWLSGSGMSDATFLAKVFAEQDGGSRVKTLSLAGIAATKVILFS